MAGRKNLLEFADHKPDSLAQKQESTKLNGDEVQEDLDDTSSSGTSSDEEDIDSADEEDIVNQTTTKPPVMRPNIDNDLRSRLSTFLPQMEKANRELEDAGDALNHRIDDVGENEDRYIEMNLGLGVLSEEQDGNDIKFESSSPDDPNQDSLVDPVEALKNLNNRNKIAQNKNKIEEI